MRRGFLAVERPGTGGSGSCAAVRPAGTGVAGSCASVRTAGTGVGGGGGGSGAGRTLSGSCEGCEVGEGGS